MATTSALKTANDIQLNVQSGSLIWSAAFVKREYVL